MTKHLDIPLPPRLALLAGLLLLVWALASAQQPRRPDELTGVISGEGAKKIALAVPPTIAPSGARAADAAELHTVLQDDLAYSGWFGLLDPRGEGRLDPGKLSDPTAWRGVGASYLLTSILKERQDRVVLEIQLVETGGGETLVHKKWGGEFPRDLRRLAHVAADDIVETLVGRPGIASTKIAFVSRHGKGKEVYLMDYDGARVRRLTTTGKINLTPSWSPDSRRLVFLSYLGRKPSIYLLSESGQVSMLHPRGGDLNSAPDFSPDSKTLAFNSDRDGNSEIYLYDLESGAERRLTFNGAIDTAPCWSPSGDRIVFTSDRSGTPQIYIMQADGSKQQRLTWEGRYNESAAWSPDGSRIAFVSRIAGQFEIVIHDLATGQESVITSGRGNKENPRWAPDGRHLVFASNRSGMYSIYTIRDDGTDLRRLTRGRESFTPDWSPVRR